ncbi:MAG: hypothetical protein PHX83_14515 [Acidobacteriia bacterium]|nr:hypothetical protein [Terriglobia bacterium]
MRAGSWLTLGVATTSVAGVVVIVAARRRLREADQSAPQLPAASSPATTAQEELPSALSASVSKWVEDLTLTHPPAPEVVTAALLFADQLSASGYPLAATRVRDTVDAALEEPSESGSSSDETEAPESHPESVWVDHYLGGWTTTADNVQMVIRDALDHLHAESDGYIRKAPSEWDALQAGENVTELERLGHPTLAAGLTDLIHAAGTIEAVQ